MTGVSQRDIRKENDKKTVFLSNLDIKEKVRLHIMLEHPYLTEQFDAVNSTLLLFHENQGVEPKREPACQAYVTKVKLRDWAVELKDKNAIHLQYCTAFLNNETGSLTDDVLVIDDTFKKRLGLEPGNIFMSQPWMYSEEEKNRTS